MFTVYVPFNVTSSSTTVDLVIRTSSSAMWNIIVSQIDPKASADVLKLAPTGCLQYFYEPVGEIQSFNYNSGNGPYLPNLEYAICFRRTDSDSKIRYLHNSTIVI